MSAPILNRPRAVFTEGSTLRHLLVMTFTGSIGLMAIFVVEMFSILYISWLGDPALTAGIGFAGQVQFFAISINIGLSIGLSALVSRAIGAGERDKARRYATNGLVHTVLVSIVFTLLLFPFRSDLLRLLGAKGGALAAGELYLDWTIPTIPLLSLGMALPGLLRCVGDARRAMYITFWRHRRRRSRSHPDSLAESRRFRRGVRGEYFAPRVDCRRPVRRGARAPHAGADLACSGRAGFPAADAHRAARDTHQFRSACRHGLCRAR